MRALVIGTLLVAATLIWAASCKPNPSPPPPPVPAQVVYQELVDAGCIAVSSTGASDLSLENTMDAAPDWLRCLFDGGSVTTCGPDCGAASTKKK